VVVIDGEAVAFLGGSGFWKSSVAASFLEAGHRLLTDDLLLMQATAGGVLAFPGPPRIKLYPKTARRFLGDTLAGVPMHPETEKLILPLNANQSCSTAVPVKAIYILTGPGPLEVLENKEIRLRPLLGRQGVVEMLSHTFNTRIQDPNRLERMLNEAARLVNLLPVRRLSFPRVWSQFTSVREAIISDLNRRVLGTAA